MLAVFIGLVCILLLGLPFCKLPVGPGWHSGFGDLGHCLVVLDSTIEAKDARPEGHGIQSLSKAEDEMTFWGRSSSHQPGATNTNK